MLNTKATDLSARAESHQDQLVGVTTLRFKIPPKTFHCTFDKDHNSRCSLLHFVLPALTCAILRALSCSRGGLLFRSCASHTNPFLKRTFSTHHKAAWQCYPQLCYSFLCSPPLSWSKLLGSSGLRSHFTSSAEPCMTSPGPEAHQPGPVLCTPAAACVFLFVVCLTIIMQLFCQLTG